MDLTRATVLEGNQLSAGVEINKYKRERVLHFSYDQIRLFIGAYHICLSPSRGCYVVEGLQSVF